MLKRSGFKKPERPERPARAWPGPQTWPTPSTKPENAVVTRSKACAVDSKPYRRLVAALPCANCQVQGYSQAAHPPPTGKGIKEDDRMCFPLCCTRPGITGCHVEFDQYRLIPKPLMRAQADQWAARTRAKIMANGSWPAKLPKFHVNELAAQAMRALLAIHSGAQKE